MLPLGRPNVHVCGAEKEERDIGAVSESREVQQRPSDQNSTPSGRSRLPGGHRRGYHARDFDLRTSPRYLCLTRRTTNLYIIIIVPSMHEQCSQLLL